LAFSKGYWSLFQEKIKPNPLVFKGAFHCGPPASARDPQHLLWDCASHNPGLKFIETEPLQLLPATAYP
jgi:hypothetical protein